MNDIIARYRIETCLPVEQVAETVQLPTEFDVAGTSWPVFTITRSSDHCEPIAGRSPAQAAEVVAGELNRRSDLVTHGV